MEAKTKATALLLALATWGCVTTNEPARSRDVAYLGPRRTPKPANCQVVLFLAEAPPYPVTAVASGRVRCSERQDCIDELMRQACGAGADLVYGFREGSDSFSAVFGVRAPTPPRATPPRARTPPTPASPPAAPTTTI